MITVDGRNKHFNIDIARRHKCYVFSSSEPKAQMNFLIEIFPFQVFVYISRTTGSISTQRGTKYHWVKRIEDWSNKRAHPFS